MKLKIGDNAPDFNLLDEDENNRSLFNYKGKWILLYFYPKDDTPGCTKEACEIRDNFLEFKKLDVVVIGISTDSVKSHKSFVEKYNLPFTLLSDENKEVVNLYGVWGKKKFMGREYDGTFRTSFLINPKGKIEKIYENVKPAKHSKEVLLDLENIKH
ncbi:MAG: thioredoxin-dependent thiol peroxidase [Patescibacteria group bacterium]